MKRLAIGIASVTALVFLAAVMAGGLYLRSLRTPAGIGQGQATQTPTDTPSDSPTPTATPSPTEVASPPTSSPSSKPPPPAGSARPAPTCPPEVITSFTARAAPQ